MQFKSFVVLFVLALALFVNAAPTPGQSLFLGSFYEKHFANFRTTVALQERGGKISKIRKKNKYRPIPSGSPIPSPAPLSQADRQAQIDEQERRINDSFRKAGIF